MKHPDLRIAVLSALLGASVAGGLTVQADQTAYLSAGLVDSVMDFFRGATPAPAPVPAMPSNTNGNAVVTPLVGSPLPQGAGAMPMTNTPQPGGMPMAIPQMPGQGPVMAPLMMNGGSSLDTRQPAGIHGSAPVPFGGPAERSAMPSGGGAPSSDFGTTNQRHPSANQPGGAAGVPGTSDTNDGTPSDSADGSRERFHINGRLYECTPVEDQSSGNDASSGNNGSDANGGTDSNDNEGNNDQNAQSSNGSTSSGEDQNQAGHRLSEPQPLHVTAVLRNTVITRSQYYINSGIVALRGAEIDGVDQGTNIVIINTATGEVSVIQKPDLLPGELVGFAKGVSDDFWTESTGRYYGWFAQTELGGFAMKGYGITYDRVTGTLQRGYPHIMYTEEISRGPFPRSYCDNYFGYSCPLKDESVGNFSVETREDSCEELQDYIYALRYLPFIHQITSYVQNCWAAPSLHHDVVEKETGTVVGPVSELPPYYALLGDENHQYVGMKPIAPIMVDGNVVVYGKQLPRQVPSEPSNRYELFVRTIQ